MRMLAKATFAVENSGPLQATRMPALKESRWLRQRRLLDRMIMISPAEPSRPVANYIEGILGRVSACLGFC